MTDTPRKVFYEQYRDTANPEPMGYILRWTIDSCVYVDAFEIDGCAGNPGPDGWPAGVSVRAGEDDMKNFISNLDNPSHEFDMLEPNFHFYMRHDGTSHLWSTNYTMGGGSAEHVLFFTDVLRYVAARAAALIQERMSARGDTQFPVFPLNYKTPTIEVKPFTPESW